jgi:hypothetical protein
MDAGASQRKGVALEHVVGVAENIGIYGILLKRVKAAARLQHFDRLRGFSRIDKAEAVVMIDEIGIERAGAFQFGKRGVVPAPEQQNPSEMGVSLRQIGVELHGLAGEVEGMIKPGGVQVFGIARLEAKGWR